MTAPLVPVAGTSPAGFLVPLNYAIPGEPAAVLADAIDPSTGELLSLFQGFDPIDAWVLTQLSTARGTGSAVEDEGRDFTDVTHILESHKRILDQEIRRPLKPLTSTRAIEISKLEIQEGDDWYDAQLHYRHLASGTERIADVPLGGLVGGAR